MNIFGFFYFIYLFVFLNCPVGTCFISQIVAFLSNKQYRNKKMLDIRKYVMVQVQSIWQNDILIQSRLRFVYHLSFSESMQIITMFLR